MEIRSALQKIENYLTVVSNLNKTILSEGTMSRDELLLMKKYLYTSIDRIEDIERSLIIDKKEDKSFTPTETVENKFVPAKEKEIVEVQETDHIEEVEAAMTNDQKEELEDLVEDIHAEILAEHKEIVGEVEHPKMMQQKVEELPVVENIITEDYSINRNAVEENIVATTTIENIKDEVVEKLPLVENIITEDYSINRNSVEENVVAETTPTIVAEEKSTTLFESIKAEVENVTETISAKFEENKTTSFVEELANKKKEETSFFEKFEQKLNATSHPQLFQLFDDGKEDLHESFVNNKPVLEPVNTNFDKPLVNSSYETNDTVLVVEKEVETIVEQLTPSSLNDVFKPQTLVENIVAKSSKTLSESIALNDKFIFVRELFGNQFAEYESALKHLDGLNNFKDAEQYCNNTLWNKFNWTERASAAGRFMDLIEKKYK